MIACAMARQPTRLPSGLNDEGAFIQTSLLSLTLRQLASLLGGLLMAYLTAELLNNILPGVIAWTLASPIVLAGIAVAFIKVRGRPIDEHIVDKLRFLTEPREYSMRDSNADDAFDVSWEDDDRG